MEKVSITALIIAHNEAEMIESCLASLEWCQECVVIDDGSTDTTARLAEAKGARVVSFKSSSFKRLREEAAKQASTDWLLYIDADERVTPLLAKQIAVHIETGEASVLEFRRKNIFFGQELQYGGWGNETVKRAFRTDVLQGWKGDIHESPVFKGTTLLLSAPLIHLTHRDVITGLRKTVAWTPMEAQALFEVGVPPVTFATLLRKGWMELFRRAVLRRGYKDGTKGLIEALIQAINRILVYIQVWELQQKPSLPNQYQVFESEIAELWKKEK